MSTAHGVGQVVGRVVWTMGPFGFAVGLWACGAGNGGFGMDYGIVGL